MKNQYEIDYQQGYDSANEEWLERMDKIRAEIESEKLEDSPNFCVKAHNNAVDRILGIIDKYRQKVRK